MNAPQTEFVQVVTTVETEDDAQRIGQAVLKQRLAACVHTEGPLRSTYWWMGELETASEYRLTFKTTAARVQEVFAAIASVHPYEVPELLVLPVLETGGDYGEWMRGQVKGD